MSAKPEGWKRGERKTLNDQRKAGENREIFKKISRPESHKNIRYF